MQKVKVAAGITAKIGRFNANASTQLILSQKKFTIDFEGIMSSGKILIRNFSKGLLCEDVAELFAIAVLARLQLASLRRTRLKQSERRALYLYVDEFQSFATPSFVQLLSEAQKYRLFLAIAWVGLSGWYLFVQNNIAFSLIFISGSLYLSISMKVALYTTRPIGLSDDGSPVLKMNNSLNLDLGKSE